MLQNLNFRTIRAIHICIVYTFTLAVQEMFNYPRAAWTGFAVMMIYAGFDSGATLRRTFHRFWGMALGLLLSFVLWFLGHIDYRILLFIIPIGVFFAHYTLGKLYMFPTIFTVTLTALGSDYYPNDTFFPSWFFSDYFICTVIALIICVVFEYFIFRGRNLTNKFYYELQQEITNSMNCILALTLEASLNRSKLLKMTAHLNSKMIEFNTLRGNTEHSYEAKDIPNSDDLQLFFAKSRKVYQNIRHLLVLHPQQDIQRTTETKALISELYELNKKSGTTIDYIGEMH